MENGTKWKDHRQLILSALTDMGMGKWSLEQPIQSEALSACAELARNECSVDHVVDTAVANIMCFFLFGER